MKATTGNRFWKTLDNLEGDKVIWTIVFFLIMASILAISSSTSLLAISSHSSRMSYAMEQVLMAVLGLGIILLCYKIGKIGLFRFFAKFGYIVSMAMLLFLLSHFQGIPFFRAAKVNDAWRCIIIFGFQLHVFEFVKVFMIMYTAWAMDALKTDRTPLADSLARIPHLGFMSRTDAKIILYVLLPIVSITMLIAPGSNSSAMFIGGIMMVTAIIGGLRIKYVLMLVLAGAAGVGIMYGAYSISDGKAFRRFGTGIQRILLAGSDPLKELHNETPGSLKFQEILDKSMQPMSAKVAVSEGGLIGKGPGKSTQRYVVSVMYEDYMFSFIVEEYGILGAIVILALYGSLLARGSLIVRSVDNHFAKTMVSGLVILISGQALMHIFINVDIGPLTGQTLPMISHGNSSFLAFSMAFGVLLSVSRMAKKKMDKASADAAPIIVKEDEIRDSLHDLDKMETEE